MRSRSSSFIISQRQISSIVRQHPTQIPSNAQQVPIHGDLMILQPRVDIKRGAGFIGIEIAMSINVFLCQMILSHQVG